MEVKLIQLIDMEDTKYDKLFIVDKVKYEAVKNDLDKLKTAEFESEIPQNELIPRSVAEEYVYGEISWYKCLLQIFDNMAIGIDSVKYFA